MSLSVAWDIARPILDSHRTIGHVRRFLFSPIRREVCEFAGDCHVRPLVCAARTEAVRMVRAWRVTGADGVEGSAPHVDQVTVVAAGAGHFGVRSPRLRIVGARAAHSPAGDASPDANAFETAVERAPRAPRRAPDRASHR